jgi:RTX calcium-binding nonapeptide repeat (4 copies)/Calcineurin-like phosphoesterase/Purple acid Phosphatase, N-terminal domain
MQLTAGAGGTASSGRIMRRVWWVLVGWLVAGWVLVAAAVPAGAAVDGALTRYPYLTDSVQTSITVNWATTTAQDTGSVRFGPEGACTASSKPASKTQITVNGLPEYQWKATIPVTPDTRYCYRVRLGATDLLGSDAAPVFTSQVAAGSSAPFSFAVFGDWGQAYATAPGQPNANPDQANVLSQIARSGARFAVMTGDTAYPNGSQTNYGDLQQTGPDISAVFGPDFWGIPGRSIPVFNVTGNHGFSSGNTQKVVWPETNVTSSSGGTYEMEDYPAMADAGTIAGRYPSFWYAFDAGPARFYVLTAAWADGNGGTNGVYAADAAAHWTPGQAEYEWLKHDLQTHPGGLKLAFWHYPLYADTPGARSDNSLQGGPGTLQGLLDANHVNLAFNGHAHGYERNAADPAGLISYVIGNGGADLGPVGSCSPFDLYAIGKNATHCGLGPAGLTDDHVFGFAKVTIDGQHITVTPTDELGRTYDIQTYTFTPPADDEAPSVPQNVVAAATAPGRVALTWTASKDDVGITGYRIYRDGALLATLSGTGTGYMDTPVAPGTAYRYRVAALDAAGHQSDMSAPALVTTPGPPDVTPPSVPLRLTAKASSSSEVLLTWGASTDDVGVAGYEVSRDGTVLGPLELTTGYDDESVVSSTTYTYRVRAIDAAGNGSAPAMVTVTTSPSDVVDPPPTGGGSGTSGGGGSSPPPGGGTGATDACLARPPGTGHGDHLRGTAKRDRLVGRGGGDLVEGFSGADCLFGGDGRDDLRGGAGDDRLSGGLGNDRLAGGRGDDTLDGGPGNDRMIGGPGRDMLRGRAGRDVIDARDGVRDVVDCGRGRDRARVDGRDRVRGCEHVAVGRP